MRSCQERKALTADKGRAKQDDIESALVFHLTVVGAVDRFRRVSRAIVLDLAPRTK